MKIETRNMSSRYRKCKCGSGWREKVSNTADIGALWGTLGPFWVDDYIFEENEDKRGGQKRPTSSHAFCLPTTSNQSMCLTLRYADFPRLKKQKNKSTFEYNQHQIILTSWNQTVCFSTVGIPPTQCIKSEPWIHFRTRSRARSRLMQCRRLWSPSSRAVMSSLPHIWKLFLGRILRRAASLKCMSHLLCSSAPWDLN